MLAIGLALATRQVIVALVLGVWVGAMLVEGNPFTAFLRVGDRYLTDALADPSHASIILFSTILGGMVGVLSRSGATGGIVHWLAGKVGGRRGGRPRPPSWARWSSSTTTPTPCWWARPCAR